MQDGKTQDARADELRALSDEALRALISDLTTRSDEELALAMCEVVRRFLDKGRKVL